MVAGISFVHWLVILSAVVSVSGATAYIRNTIAGRTKPNKVSWFLWAFLPLTATAAAISAGADLWPTVRTFLAGFLPLIVLSVSFFNPQSYWKLTKFDYACGAISAVALALWGLAGSPQLAILFLAVADACACLPTVLKAWKFPETETGLTYVASLFSVLLVMPSITDWNIQNSAFQIALLINNFALLFSVYRKRIPFFRN